MYPRVTRRALFKTLFLSLGALTLAPSRIFAGTKEPSRPAAPLLNWNATHATPLTGPDSTEWYVHTIRRDALRNMIDSDAGVVYRGTK